MTGPNCRACGANNEKQFIRAPYVFGGSPEHKFWECRECGLIYLWPIPSEEEEALFYAKEFEKFMSTRSGGDRDWSKAEAHIKTNQDQVKRRWNFLEKYLARGKEILEIGCSSGFMLDAFKEAGLRPIGIEPSGTFRDFLKKKGHEVYDQIQELILKRPTLKFDLIVHFFVLEHIRNTKEFFQQHLKLLKPSGSIIAEVPCVNDPLTSLYKISAFEKFYWSIAHHYYFGPKSLSHILDQIDCKYEFLPEQRYDLSNHLVWMLEGKPGGQGKYSHIFSKATIDSYKKDLINSWCCDTLFLYVTKR